MRFAVCTCYRWRDGGLRHTRRSDRNLHVSRISRTSASYCAAAVGPGPLVRIGGRHLTATRRPRHSHSYTAPNPPEPCQAVRRRRCHLTQQRREPWPMVSSSRSSDINLVSAACFFVPPNAKRHDKQG